MKKISESPKQKIERLYQEFTSLKQERNKFNLEAKEFNGKRNILNERIRDLRKEATKTKEKRDELNETVHELKKLRDEVKIKRKERVYDIKELKEKLKELTENRPKRNLLHIEREIANIDWKIQTSSLSVKEEEILINQVRQLEAQLLDQKRIRKIKEEIKCLQGDEKNLGTQGKILHEKLSELAEQSQKFHKQMVETLDKIRQVQVEADGFHQKYVKTKQKAQKIHKKCIELLDEIREIERELKEISDKKHDERQSKLQKELEERALAKFKSGKKLIWEEFKILAEKGIL